MQRNCSDGETRRKHGERGKVKTKCRENAVVARHKLVGADRILSEHTLPPSCLADSRLIPLLINESTNIGNEQRTRFTLNFVFCRCGFVCTNVSILLLFFFIVAYHVCELAYVCKLILITVIFDDGFHAYLRPL